MPPVVRMQRPVEPEPVDQFGQSGPERVPVDVSVEFDALEEDRRITIGVLIGAVDVAADLGDEIAATMPG